MLRMLLAIALASGIAACSATAPVSSLDPPPSGKQATGRRGMVSSASPHASSAGLQMLREGGNAVDAAVAAAFAVGVVEPQMSGLGGGGSMTIWRQEPERADYLDFYSSQPADPFLAFDDLETRDSTRALWVVAIPGAVAGLLEAHERFGRLPRATVMAPAVRLAEQGFPVNQILAQMIARDSTRLLADPGARALLFPDGRPLGAGERLRNPALAETLRRVAERGRAGFYQGSVANDLIRRLRNGGHPASANHLTEYRPQWRRPLCGVYRGNVVLSAPPPQTGLQIIHTLQLLEDHDLPNRGLPTESAEAFDILASALRLGMAANAPNGDPAWQTVPAAGTASIAFARQRRAEVGTGVARDTIRPEPADSFDATPPVEACRVFDPYGPAVPVADTDPLGAHDADNDGETTHLSVVDADGNAVALTQTNSSVFGAGVMVAGFFLNNSAYSFTDEDRSIVSHSRWRTRRSTISPTVVLRDGRVQLVVGAPGGGRIPTAMVQNIVYLLDYELNPIDALRVPRMFPTPRGRRVQIEHGFDAGMLEQVRAMGYEPDALSFGYARLYVVVRDGDQWIGAADPRHDGAARGY